MANTFTQVHVQLIFAVSHRENMIIDKIRVEVQKYITGIVQNNGHKMLAIYCMPDHTHLLIGLNPPQSISDCVKKIKTCSSKWINKNKMIPFKFNWQEGYGAFSYSRSQISNVINYIEKQPEHHRKRTFKEEYMAFLARNEVDYDERYLFEWLK